MILRLNVVESAVGSLLWIDLIELIDWIGEIDSIEWIDLID
ncbi:MAG: hypothetical protein PWP06_1739 [Candidatus Marinimicrobia bacterium]|jgi:hypothetical protein|nr:hypothetical protein [Candidatus Neomarinimicrobiota bacterium]